MPFPMGVLMGLGRLGGWQEEGQEGKGRAVKAIRGQAGFYYKVGVSVNTISAD